MHQLGVAHLAAAAVVPVVQIAVDEHRPADTVAEHEIEEVPVVRAGPALGKGRGVCIVAQPHREGDILREVPGEQLIRPAQGFAIIAVCPVFFRETGHADAHAQNVGGVQPGIEDQVVHQPPQLPVIIRRADEWDLQPLSG